MEENKKSMPIWLVVVLSVLGTCLVGFCVWYGVKYFKGEETEEQPSDQNVEQVGEKIDFPQKSDDSVIVVGQLLSEEEKKSNFKNLKKEIGGYSIVYNCKEYSDVYSECAKIELTINNELTIELNNVNKIYLSGDYYFVYYTNVEIISWFDIYKNSEKIYSSSDRIKDYYWESSDFDYNKIIYVKPAIVNNQLHFVEVDEKYTIPRENAKLKHNVIDLTKDKIEVKTVKEFYGYFDEK